MSADQAPDAVYGLLRVGRMDVALPLAALREVVPCPAELADLPASAAGLRGALELRRMVLPVLDLGAVLDREVDGRADRVVVVVASAGRVLGLLADEVRGICRVPADALVPVGTEVGDLLFSTTFRHPETGRAHSVLDAAALLALPGVPTAADLTRETGAAAASAGRGRRTLTVLRCGPHRLALDAAHVHTTVPLTSVRPSVLSSRLCAGTTESGEDEVPVVDPLVLLGLGQLPRDELGAGVVLDLGRGRVVLGLSELVQLAHVEDSALLAVPPFALRRPDLVSAVATVDGLGDCLVLDGEGLLADPDLLALAAVSTAPPAGSAAPGPALPRPRASASRGPGEAAGPRDAPTYLTFTSGVDLATRLDHVAEILPLPDAALDTAVEGLLGVITHRATAVPVVCLAAALGLPPRARGAAGCLLLVDADGTPVAFAVDALGVIAPRTWADAGQAVRGPATDRGTALRSSPLVRVGDGDHLLPDVDLPALARRLGAVRGRGGVGHSLSELGT